MKSFLENSNHPPKMVVALLMIIPQLGWAVTGYRNTKRKYVSDFRTFRTTLHLDVKGEKTKVKMPVKKVKTRLIKAGKDERIEAISINVPRDAVRRENLAFDIAKENKSLSMKKYLDTLIQQQDNVDYNGKSYVRVKFDKKALHIANLKKIADIYANTHYDIAIDTKLLRRSRSLRNRLTQQLTPFLSQNNMKTLKRAIWKKDSLDLNKYFLPKFAQKMVEKFTIYRGPNCFHAALAFHGQKLTRSPYFNVKKEKGYHRAMINYDELWRAVNYNFYEIDPKTTPLKYGDLIMFFDVEDMNRSPYFKWIRHAATYLFGNYTFSKGSKSPNSAYSVKTLEDEWTTWKRLTKNLQAKVFRRSRKSVNTRPPTDLQGWYN